MQFVTEIVGDGAEVIDSERAVRLLRQMADSIECGNPWGSLTMYLVDEGDARRVRVQAEQELIAATVARRTFAPQDEVQF